MNQEQRDKIDRIKQYADRKIWVTFRKEGIHKYPAAASDPALATGDEYDVSFLGVPHRHIYSIFESGSTYYTMIEISNSFSSSDGSRISTAMEHSNSTTNLAK